MIATLRGTVAHTSLDTLIIEVGGVGMLVHTTPANAANVRVGDVVTLWTTLVVREDSLTLFGFVSAGEKTLFEQVQTVSGVGPRLALAMLAVHDADTLAGAISSGNIPVLMKVPGIGKKGAERIVLELRDKIISPTTSGVATTVQEQVALPVDTSHVEEALVGLGWSAKQAQDALSRVNHLSEADGAPTSVLLRLALQELGR